MSEMESKDSESAPQPATGRMRRFMVWGVIFALGVVSGSSVPLLLASANSGVSNSSQPANPQMAIPEADDKQAFIEFEEIVVNLNDDRYSRYVTCVFSLQVANSQQAAIQALVDEKRVVLKNWIIAHLRDKKLEDVRGKLGHNTLRREIHDKFNALLFSDGIERIQDVLFQDFKVQ